MAVPAFQLHLADQILKDKATVARYDGKNPSLSCATVGSKVLVHSPHASGDQGDSLFYLNINREITAVRSGRIVPGSQRDVLFVGTPTNLQAFDVEQNRDLFFKDSTDEVSSLVVGQLGGVSSPVVFVGGNCSVQGLDAEGQEVYWTVAGDVVSSLALADINADGSNELLVGGRDFEIRAFQHEDCVLEVTEAETVSGLAGVKGSRFAYSLVNGTVGVYDKRTRAWRVKSKHTPNSIVSFDMDGDGVPEVISGWSNGKFEVRSQAAGQVVLRDTLSSSVSSVLAADFRNDGTDCLIVCAQNGEVKGYSPFDPDLGRIAATDSAEAAKAVTELSAAKNEIKAELERLQGQNRAASAAAFSDQESAQAPPGSAELIKRDTDVICSVQPNSDNGSVDIALRTNNSMVIRGILIFAERLFDGESLYVYPKTPSTSVTVPVRPKKDAIIDVMVKVFVSSSASNPVYKVFELETRLSKFCMFKYIGDGTNVPHPQSHVQLLINERTQRFGLWLEERFNVVTEGLSESKELLAQFTHLRSQKPLILCLVPSASGPKTLWIRTDDMEVAADLVQDLAFYLGVDELESTAEFPVQMEAFKDVLQRVDNCNATRLKLTAEVAESSHVVKSLVIRAEDSRIQGHVQQMKASYRQLHALNRQLIMEHDKRATNYEDLLAGLKEVNQMVQTASRLRVGAASKRVVAACRQAIKAQNTAMLLKILRSGQAV